MKQIRLYLTISIFSFFTVWNTISQVGPKNSDLTAEQEAMKQTNRLQRELNLSPDQIKQLYELNLKYARDRRQSEPTRTEVLKRGKEKEQLMRKILTKEQYLKLQSKRYEKSNVD